MKRSGPLKRKTSLKARSQLKAKGPVKAVSQRRDDRRMDRISAVAEAARREGSGCWMHWHSDCFGQTHGHELIGRYAWPDGIYEPLNIVPLCNRHNRWVEGHHLEALALGIRLPADASRTTETFDIAAKLRREAVLWHGQGFNSSGGARRATD